MNSAFMLITRLLKGQILILSGHYEALFSVYKAYPDLISWGYVYHVLPIKFVLKKNGM
jgi:hypothetical protein